MLLGGPAGHVGPNLRQQAERVIGPDPVDLGQVDAGELVQRGPDIETRFVVARLLSAPRGRQRGRRRDGRGRELREVPLDRRVAGGELPLIDVKEFEILVEDEDVLGPLVAGQRGDDLGRGRMAAIVPMLGERVRVTPARHDIAEDAETGHPRDVADHERELHVHLDQGLLHPLHEGARALDQRGSMPEIPAQSDDAVGGTEAPPQQPEHVEIAEPFAVGDITLPTRKILDVSRVDEDDLKPTGVENLEDGNPGESSTRRSPPSPRA